MPLASTQPSLVTPFKPQVARVVARLVVGVFFNVIAIDFPNVAQHVGSGGVVVLTQDALHNVEAGEAVEFFLYASIVLRGEMADEYLFCVGRVVLVFRLVLHVGYTLVKLGTGNLQGVAKVYRVKGLHVLGHHHQVIGGLVIHDQLAVAVVDEPSRGVQGLLDESVAVGILLVGTVIDLQFKEPQDVDNRNQYNEASNDVFPFFKVIIFSHGGCLLKSRCRKSIK